MSIVPPSGPSAIEASPPCARAIARRDEESQPRARPVLVARGTPVGEPLEDRLSLVRRDAGTTIDDIDERVIALLSKADLDRGVRPASTSIALSISCG